MDFKSLLQSMTTLSEAEGKVHKGTYGTSHGKEDVRDQYGHKVGKVDKEAGSKKDAPKKGRGRPKKGADDSGEVKTYDTKTLGDVFGGGKKPKKEIGKVSKKHSLKEYMESVEDTKHAESVMEGMFGGVDHTNVAANLGKLAKVIKSVQTPEQFKVAQKYAQRMSGTIMKHQHDNSGFGSGLRANIAVSRAIQDDLKRKAAELGIDYQSLEETGVGQVEIKPASQTQTQVIQQGDKTLGTVNNPQLAAQIKQSIGKGEMTLNPDEQNMQEGKDEGKPGKNFAKIAKSAGEKYGSKAAGERVAGAVRAKLAKQGKLEESISLTESPATLQHIINRFKNEVKRFVNGEELDHDLYEALYDYYSDIGEIPYGTAKGRTGDPYEWVTQRFDQDVQNHVQQPKLPLGRPAVDEGSFDDFRQHALAEPTSNFTKPGSPMAVPRGTPTEINRPVPNPTPWGTDPIAAATDRAFNFVSSLGKGTKFTKEGTDMKDIQLEGWEKQLNGLLAEGITVSSSQGQQGSPDSVSITATDNDAQTLMSVLRNAGIGGFGAEQGTPEIGYGVAQGGEEEATGTGTEPQPSPDVVGDDGDMLSMLKKMAGLEGGDAEVIAVSGDEEGQDYEDEEGEEPQTLEPADSGEDDGKEELTGSEDESEEKTDEGNDFTEKLKKTPKGGKFEIGGKTYTDTSNLEEDDMEEGAGAMHLAKEKAEKEGKSSFTLGDKTFPVKEGEDTCMECGGSMYEGHSCGGHEQVEENFANDAGGDAMGDTELAKLKALLTVGNDLHKMKTSQALGNPIRVAESEIIDWKKLSGIK